MTTTPQFDLQAAHHYFSMNCFNQTWDFMDKPSRTPEEDQYMVLLAIASYWHWTERTDVTPTNLSVGLWQISRAYALTGDSINAAVYAQRCLDIGVRENVPPFYLGFAYEALARAAKIAGESEKSKKYLSQAYDALKNVVDPEEKQMLSKDLEEIRIP